ncbi:MAG: AmmeMemoRadiSam system protein A [Thermodesulfobacteriaceae bacterium]|nr:AmmeMemoRadiSam system protein A [Thermodesulfobacteriaceae bacterium]MCX8041484.1 AmmeMemoRadiSam system protein A [Thermodesulfobacteriaceae bacterium]MDW8135954.1 AmmeMemoRadiSam system protein A [Thermodesulfobacterium sp.]
MLKEEEKLFLLKLARKVLEDFFENKNENYFPSKELKNLWEERGAFVTLFKNKKLRGCVGVLEAFSPLYEVIKEMALSAAFKDPRFPPLEAKELPLIEIEISVLSPLKKGSIEEIEIGKHGVYLVKGFNRGVLLPQVPLEFGWDRETFLKQVCLKAGLEPNCYQDPDSKIYIFTAEIFKESDFRIKSS